MGKTIFCNGEILTMEEGTGREDRPEAVLVDQGKIQGVGSLEQMKDQAGTDYRLKDLEGHTLMPAFIDPHSHFTACANRFLEASLDQAEDFDQIIQRIQDFIRESAPSPGQWIQASGYDHNRLKEKRHPDRHVLDQAAPDYPLVIKHQSGHMGVYNTLALKLLGADENTQAPEGGLIAMEDGQPSGYMEETAFLQYLSRIPMPSPEDFLAAYEKAQKRYLSYGITTVQEGMMNSQMEPLYRLLLTSRILKVDLTAYVDAGDQTGLMERLEDYRGTYRDHLRVGGWKMFLDGSPQGRTAWLRKPYLPAPGQTEDYRGYPALEDAKVYEWIKRAQTEKCQILAHCNGDGACGQYLEQYEKVLRDMPQAVPGEIRPVMVHAQLLGLDQMDQVKRLGVIPSFFLAHVYHWGDIHIQNLGLERASRISPAASALKYGIRFTLHQDSPVIQPDMMETLWCAACRRTASGRLLGGEERIDVWEALKAVTIHGAYQYFEEDSKGSIRPGKQADLMILEKNPLRVPLEELPGISVLETMKEGETVYQKTGLS